MGAVRVATGRLLNRRLTWVALALLIAVQAATLVIAIANTDLRLLAAGSPDYFLNTFSTGLAALVAFLSICLAVYGFVLGAAYVGGELRTGGPAGRLGSRLGVAAGVVLALSALAAAIYIGGFWIVASTAGPSDPGDHWGDLVWLSVRGALLASAAAVFGAALAALTRRTAVALLLAVGYVIVWELGGRELLRALEATAGRPYLFTQAGAWLTGEPGYWLAGGLIIAALLALTVAAAWARQRRG
jgi:hypothetical protein